MVIIAASGDQKALLEQEFPFLSFVGLPGYGIKYGKNRAFTVGKIMFSLPKILIRIKRENAWLSTYIRLQRPDAVISDNRFGLYHQGLFSVFITHQLQIKTPFGHWADRCLQRLNYRAIRRFSACWVPDWEEGSKSLAGELSHPRVLPAIPLRYIGPLSRFGPPAIVPATATSTMVPATMALPEVFDLLVLISGPEPQRSLFEKMVRDQIKQFAGRAVLLRGLPGRMPDPGSTHSSDRVQSTHLHIYDHLPASDLNKIIGGAALVISRPGYSSVMDLFRLGKKCIFIPTPGQTEQEYLGDYLSSRQLALCIPQAAFNLSEALKQAAAFPFKSMAEGVHGDTDPLRAAVADLVRRL